MTTERGPLTRALERALRTAPTLDRDAAAVALAKKYAGHLDHDDATPDLLAELGPKLLAVLTALGMTPAGRGVKGGPVNAGNGGEQPDELDEFRRRAAERRNGDPR